MRIANRQTNRKLIFHYGKVIVILFHLIFIAKERATGQVQATDEFLSPSVVSVRGILGQAITKSENGRLTSLPNWRNGELINIFSPESRSQSKRFDWYGEHAGKWLYTTAIATHRSGNQQLKELLIKTADILVSNQEADGYLGTYSQAQRITTKEDISHNRSWDVWNLSYLTLGLLEVHKYYPNVKYLNAAKKIGELFLVTFGDGEKNITSYGTRYGISATIALDPVVELYNVTQDTRYLDFAKHIVQRMEEREGVKLISMALANRDMEFVGDGKIYQIIWNLTAMVKLYRVTGNTDYMKAAENAWKNISEFHLTITGGPWGGIGKHKECFNSQNYWSPYGYIETCSVMSWIQFNKEMFRVTGEAKYAQEIEKSAYNALMGAQFPNGQDWCYHSFTNGRRHVAHFNDCCSSSGALALEELSSMIYSIKEQGIAFNLYSESEVEVLLSGSNQVRVIQETNYPFEGNIRITLMPSKKASFPLLVRIPEWAKSAEIKVNGGAMDTKNLAKGTYFKIERAWKNKDVIEVQFPMEINVVQKSEKSMAPQDGKEIYSVNWFALTRGPLVFATNGLINGKEREKTFQLPAQNCEEYFKQIPYINGQYGPAFELQLPDQAPLRFEPFYLSGDANAGGWRLTWIQNSIDQ